MDFYGLWNYLTDYRHYVELKPWLLTYIVLPFYLLNQPDQIQLRVATFYIGLIAEEKMFYIGIIAEEKMFYFGLIAEKSFVMYIALRSFFKYLTIW